MSDKIDEINLPGQKEIKVYKPNTLNNYTKGNNQEVVELDKEKSEIEKELGLSSNKFGTATFTPQKGKEEIEQSMLELKDYMETITPAKEIETMNTELANSQHLSFRPKNLPKKSKEEEEYHRKLVEANKKAYIEMIQKKQIKEQMYRAKLIEKKKKQKELTKIWLEKLLPNWSKIKHNNEIKKYFYMGIPPGIRGSVWILCLGNTFSITKDYYQIQVKIANEYLDVINKNKEKNKEKIKNEINNTNNNNTNTITNNNINDNKDSVINYEDQSIVLKHVDKEKSIAYIDLDIERTFPYLNIFKTGTPMAEDLREILRTFVVSRPDIGYVQGLSFIAGMLLLNMDKFKAFVSLMNLILNPLLLPFFKVESSLIHKRLQLFKKVFHYNLPELCDHFDKLELQPEHYFLVWNMTIFSHDINVDIAARIWDVFMIDGYKAIYSAAIVFLSHFEQEFLQMDFAEIMTKLNEIKNINFDDDMLIDAMQKVQFPTFIQFEIDKLSHENIPL